MPAYASFNCLGIRAGEADGNDDEDNDDGDEDNDNYGGADASMLRQHARRFGNRETQDFITEATQAAEPKRNETEAMDIADGGDDNEPLHKEYEDDPKPINSPIG